MGLDDPHGIDVEQIPFRDHKDDFFCSWAVSIPRRAPTSRSTSRVKSARDSSSGKKCSDPHEIAFFEEAVEPRLGPDVEWLGEVDEETKQDLLARARALLFPIRWDEPFGLVMIEAMAAGTPVLAFRRGSVPEVVADGVTGVIGDGPEELVEAIASVPDFDPQACRDHVRHRFSTDSMIDRYESLFSGLARQASSEAPVPVA